VSASPEEFFEKHAKAWRTITHSAVYRDAIDTIKRTSPSLKVMEFTPPEVAGIGHIILAKQQGVIETLQALDELADIPPDFADEEPPNSARYPDPLSELEDEETKPKPRKRK
jgi:hypothetical protein